MIINGNMADGIVKTMSANQDFSDLTFVVAYENESLWEVAERMISHQIDGMPVVRQNEKGNLKALHDVPEASIKSNIARNLKLFIFSPTKNDIAKIDKMRLFFYKC